MPSVSTDVMSHSNQTSPPSNKGREQASYSLGVCSITTGLWTTEKLFSAAVSHITHSLIQSDGMLGFGECLANVYYPSALFQPSSLMVVVCTCLKMFFMLFLVNWILMTTINILVNLALLDWPNLWRSYAVDECYF